MNTQQLINLLILVLFFGLPAIGHIAKKMIEKREELKRRHASEIAQREALRTGRVDGSSRAPRQAAGGEVSVAAAAGTQQQAEAARKQAQLQEMRRRQQERLRQAAQQRQRGSVPAPAQAQRQPTPQQRPAQPAMRTQTPIQTQQREAPQMVARGKSRPTEQAARAPQARSKYGPDTPPAAPREDLRTRLARREREAEAAKVATKERRKEGRTVPRQTDRSSVHDTAWDKRRPDRGSVHEHAWDKNRDDTFSWDAVEEQGAAHLLGRKMSPQDWRNAVIMQEVLARPVSLRERGEQGIF